MKKIVYLTFDDGPSKYTPPILDILDKYKVKATFFVIGKNPEILKDIAKRGHSIGLHSYSHDYRYIYSNEENFFKDLDNLEILLDDTIGYSPRIIRFPGGSSNTISLEYNEGIMTRLAKEVNDRGLKYYDWNCITGDGNEFVTPEMEIDYVKTCLNEKTIYLLAHDTKQETVDALEEIIKLLIENNYEFEVITYSTPEYHQRIQN